MRATAEGDYDGAIQATRLAPVLPAYEPPSTLEDINRMVGRMGYGVQVEFKAGR